MALLPAVLYAYWRKSGGGATWWMVCSGRKRRTKRRGRYEEHLGSSLHQDHSALANQLHNGLSVYIDAMGREEAMALQSSSSSSSGPAFGISVSLFLVTIDANCVGGLLGETFRPSYTKEKVSPSIAGQTAIVSSSRINFFIICHFVGWTEQAADRKWQVPRKWLVLEANPLGEGEFGTVVRATVTASGGISGTSQSFCSAWAECIATILGGCLNGGEGRTAAAEGRVCHQPRPKRFWPVIFFCLFVFLGGENFD